MVKLSILNRWMIGLSCTFILCGIGLIIIGALAIDYAVKYADFVTAKYHAISVVTLSLGVVSLALAFNGFYDVITKTPHLLILLFLIFAGLIGIVFGSSTFAYNSRDEMMLEMEKLMTEILEKYRHRIDNESKVVLDYIQLRMNCCGVHNHNDYVVGPNATEMPGISFNASTSVPASCCGEVNGTCVIEGGTEGCLDVLHHTLSARLIAVASLVIVTAFFQLLALAVATLLDHILMFIDSTTSNEAEVKEDGDTEKVKLEEVIDQSDMGNTESLNIKGAFGENQDPSNTVNDKSETKTKEIS